MLTRRAWLGGLLGLAGCGDCAGTPPPPAPPLPPSTPAPTERWTEVSFPASDHFQAEHAVISKQGQGQVLVALHGRGEVDKGLQGGARGWRDDYALDRAIVRAGAPPLTRDDFLGFVSESRLQALNASLEAHPFVGLAVACPWAPALKDRSPAGSEAFARFIIEDLIPRARKEAAAQSSTLNGIDGVSMGGRLALQIGLRHPEVFRTIGALQPAIGEPDIPELVSLAKAAATKVEDFAFRLATSTDDYFRPAVFAFSKALIEAGVKHALVETPGPHDYAYNRGPGGYEMLLWHERRLRGLPAP